MGDGDQLHGTSIVLWRSFAPLQSRISPSLGGPLTNSLYPRASSSQRVVLVDDDADVCLFVEAMLRSVGVPVRSVGSVEALMETWDRANREVVLLDIELPGRTGLDLLEHEGSAPQITAPIVVLTGRADVGRAVRAIRAGAADLLEKPPTMARLMGALERAFVAENNSYADQVEAAEMRDQIESLTPRELEITPLLCQGHTNADVAAILDISARTVEVHRARILAKTKSDSSTDLVNRSWRLGMGRLLGLDR